MVSGKRTQRLLQFFVKTLHGATRVLRMDDKQCIADVIETALHDAPRSVRCQVLVKYKSKIVPLEQTLEETGIQNLETMYLALCLRRSSRWLEAFELFQQIRDRCGVALAGGILPGAKLNELQQFVEGFLGIVNKCNASEQRVLGQILVEEGGLGQLAGLVLGQSEKHPEAR